MTEAEYIGLLAEMRERLARVEYLACPSLHPTRQATGLRAELGLIRAPLEPPAGFKARVKRALPWLVLLTYCLKRTIALGLVRVAAIALAPRVRPVDLVLRSWVVTDSQQALARDFYLGDLPAALEREGRSIVRLLRQAGRSSQLALNLAILHHGDTRVIPEDLFVPIAAPLRSLCRLLLSWVRLRVARHHAASSGSPEAVVKRAVLRDLSSIETAMALEIHAASRVATTRLRPRTYLTFYEGYSWEQCAWLGIDRAGLGTTIVGFNHTVICRSNYALRYPTRSAWHRTVPDHIVCVGDAQRELLEASHRGYGTAVLTLGSPRVNGAAPVETWGEPRPYDVIVLPEGILEECVLLFQLAADSADRCPGMRFLVRLHPVLPFDALPPALRDLIETRPNIALSTERDFGAALRQCRCVLYRGSSAVFQAIQSGLVPIQYQAVGADDVDPLWGGEDARETCSNAIELVETVRRVTGDHSCWTVDRHRRAAVTARRYGVPFQASAIRELAAVAGQDR